MAVLVLLSGAYLTSKPSATETACNLALNQAAALLSSGDALGSRSQTVLAMASCSGESRVKVEELQSAADKIIASQANCERNFRRIGIQITERRLQSASATHDKIDTACKDSLKGQNLRTQIENGQAAVNNA